MRENARPAHLLHIVTKAFQPYFTCPPAPAAMLGLQWYPFATVQRPETFCFARSVRDVPVSLVDGLTGKVTHIQVSFKLTVQAR